jgi:hypothetical protein
MRVCAGAEASAHQTATRGRCQAHRRTISGLDPDASSPLRFKNALSSKARNDGALSMVTSTTASSDCNTWHRQARCQRGVSRQ